MAKSETAPSPEPGAGRKVRRNTSLLGQSRIFTPEVIDDIHIKSELGRYRMRGFSMFKKIPHWDDPDLSPRHPHPLRHRGLPGEVRHGKPSSDRVRSAPWNSTSRSTSPA